MHLCVVTRNKSIAATTLHALMNLNMHAMHKGIHVEVHFMNDMSTLPKLIKTGERVVWFDYASNIDEDTLPRLLEPFEKDIKVMVCPAVKEGVDWEMFRKKTLAGSKEPAHQRGLTFDTEVGKKWAEGVYEVTKSAARVWAMDTKPIDKKLRGEKVQIKLATESYEALFDQLTRLVKVGAFTKAQVVCHIIHECPGNILETQAIRVGK
jgi:hypothetical protein